MHHLRVGSKYTGVFIAFSLYIFLPFSFLQLFKIIYCDMKSKMKRLCVIVQTCIVTCAAAENIHKKYIFT